MIERVQRGRMFRLPTTYGTRRDQKMRRASFPQLHQRHHQMIHSSSSTISQGFFERRVSFRDQTNDRRARRPRGLDFRYGPEPEWPPAARKERVWPDVSARRVPKACSLRTVRSERQHTFTENNHKREPIWRCIRDTEPPLSMLSAFGVVSWGGAPIRVSAGSPGLLPSHRSLLLGPANLRTLDDARGRRGVLGAASLGTAVGVGCVVGVQGSPTGRGAGSLRHAPPSSRASSSTSTCTLLWPKSFTR